MTWWCSARGTAWDWSWQPYPGVWLFIGVLAFAYVAALRRSGIRRAEGRTRAAFFAGLVMLWLALDWPIGALGAGYLASVHMAQFLMITLLAPPLLLLGVPRAVYERLGELPRVVSVLRLVTHPLIALAVFGVAVYWTHLPGVVDALMVTQAGSFALDIVWLLGGLVFWWPVVAPVPERPRFPSPLKMGYLFLATVVNTLPYAFLTFGDLPFYGLYELAPPVAGITTRQDQQIAGLLMKMGGGLILWGAITIVFFRWFQREEAGNSAGGPAADSAGGSVGGAV